MNDWNMFSELPEAGDFTPPPQPEIHLDIPERKKYYPKPPKKEPKKRKPKGAEERLIYEAQESAWVAEESDIAQENSGKRAYKKNRVYYGDDEEARRAASYTRTKNHQKSLYRTEIWLNPVYDQNIIDYLESRGNKTQYIRGLILNDMLENNE